MKDKRQCLTFVFYLGSDWVWERRAQNMLVSFLIYCVGYLNLP